MSCQETIKEKTTLSYFDTSEFLNKEIKELSSQKFAITKEIVLNGKTEIKNDIVVDTTFLNDEFKLLKSANVNKPALLGFYNVDTSDINSLKQIHYFPLAEKESKFKTKELNVVYNQQNENNVEEVSVIISSKNFMHAYNKELVYKPKLSLSIKSWEKTMFQDTLFYETKLIFRKN